MAAFYTRFLVCLIHQFLNVCKYTLHEISLSLCPISFVKSLSSIIRTLVTSSMSHKEGLLSINSVPCDERTDVNNSRYIFDPFDIASDVMIRMEVAGCDSQLTKDSPTKYRSKLDPIFNIPLRMGYSMRGFVFMFCHSRAVCSCMLQKGRSGRQTCQARQQRVNYPKLILNWIILEPRAMDWLVDLESTCSALGTADGKEYVRDEQCEEGVKDLIRFVSVISKRNAIC